MSFSMSSGTAESCECVWYSFLMPCFSSFGLSAFWMQPCRSCRYLHGYVDMAYVVMVYIVMAYVIMAYTVMACMVVAGLDHLLCRP